MGEEKWIDKPNLNREIFWELCFWMWKPIILPQHAHFKKQQSLLLSAILGYCIVLQSQPKSTPSSWASYVNHVPHRLTLQYLTLKETNTQQTFSIPEGAAIEIGLLKSAISNSQLLR